MTWTIVVLAAYLIGSIPTAYLAGRFFRGRDIRSVGDLNVGAQNAFRHLGRRIGVAVGLVDFGKGAAAVLLAGAIVPYHQPSHQLAQFLAGAAAVVGHNWPVFLSFRGGRGEATTIGVLYVLVTVPAVIVTIPAVLTLVFTRNVILASVVAFVPLPFVSWWLGIPGAVVAYSLALLGIVAFTHLIRTRRLVNRQA